MTTKLQNVINLTADSGTKKPNKINALELLEKAIAEDLSEHEWACLYKYFLPAIPAKPKNSVDWARKVVPKKDVRFYLNYLHVNSDKILHATDGFILAETANHNLQANAYYCAKAVNMVNVDARYPNTDRIFNLVKYNEIDLLDTVTHQITCETVKVGDKANYAYHYTYKGGEIALSKKYTDIIMSNPSPCVAMLVKDAHSGVLFKFENGDRAVVMPVRL